MFGDFLSKLVAADVDPRLVEKEFPTPALVAARQRDFKKPHLIYLLSKIAEVAALAENPQVRRVAVDALALVAVQGWA